MKFSLLFLFLFLVVSNYAQNKNIHNQKYEEIFLELDSSNLDLGLRSQIKFAVHFVNKKSKVFSTKGFGKGKINWSEIYIESQGATVIKDIITVTNNPSLIVNHKVKLFFKYQKTNETFLTKEIHLNYKGKYIVDHSGKDGDIGSQRRDGNSGTPGSSNNDGNGGNGRAGNDGKDGRNGLDGKNGDNLSIFLEEKIIHESLDTLLCAYVTNLEKMKKDTFLVNINSGKLEIHTNGGSGGDGGDGGFGGEGGSGGSGSMGRTETINEVTRTIPPGSGGDGGDGGNGGSGGDGGDGGSGGDIEILGTVEGLSHLDIIKINADAGVAGRAGKRGGAGIQGQGGIGGRGKGKGGNPGVPGTMGQKGSPGKRNGNIKINKI